MKTFLEITRCPHCECWKNPRQCESQISGVFLKNTFNCLNCGCIFQRTSQGMKVIQQAGE